MLPIRTVFFVLAACLLLAAAANVSSSRVNLLALGLFFWVLGILVPA